MKSFRTIVTVISLSLQSSRRFSVSAAKSSNSYTRTPQRGLSSSAISGRSISSRMSSTLVDGLDAMNQEFCHPHLSQFRAEDVSFINSSVAKSIDDDLMFNDGSFSLDQLMELAGFSVASAVHDFYTQNYYKRPQNKNSRKVLIISGPGNNGGDGLVAARHLKHFGYSPTVVYPKQSVDKLKLVRQCNDLGIEVLGLNPFPVDSEDETDAGKEKNKEEHELFLIEFDLIVDSIFGFSFEGPPRDPFKAIIAALARTQAPVISVDVPSGWHVEDGDIHKSGLMPLAVISLTAPKKCIEGYGGVHYIGGRFIPPDIAELYGLEIPDYGFGTNQIVVSVPSVLNAQTLTKSTLISNYEKDDMESLSVIYSTVNYMYEAEELAEGLLERGLVACISSTEVTSVYMWEGKMQKTGEVQMKIKTRTSLVPAVSEYLNAKDYMDLPEVLVVPVSGGSKQYLDWVRTEATGISRNIKGNGVHNAVK